MLPESHAPGAVHIPGEFDITLRNELGTPDGDLEQRTVAELQSQFKAAVDDYLEDCKSQGVTPEKPASGMLLLRVPPEVHSKALVAAQARGKSLNQWATEALQRAVAADG